MFRKLLIIFILIPGAMMGGLAGLALVSVSFEPMILKQGFSGDSYKRAEKWLEHISTAFEQDQLNRISLDSQDISDLVSYGSGRLKVGNKKLVTLEGIKTEFTEDKVITRFTLKPAIPQNIYLNISMSFSEQDGLPRWDYFQVGHSYWPGDIITWVVQSLVIPNLSEKKSTLWQTMTGAVERFSIVPGKVSLAYRSDADLRKLLKAQASAMMLGSPEEREILQLYLDVMAASAAQQSGTELALSKIFVTLFGLAKARSDDGSAVEENSRLLKALAIQVADAPTRKLLAPGMKPVSLDRPIILRGRADLTQHFLVSAALALQLDEETALNIGVGKERADSKAGGSGFSMVDLMADMAGIRFASVATENETKARKLQELMLTKQGESVFIPRVHWLPEGMSAAAYNDLVRHPKYPAMLDKIIKRLNSLPVQSDI